MKHSNRVRWILAALVVSAVFGAAEGKAAVMRFERLRGLGCGANECVLGQGVIGVNTAADFREFARLEDVGPGAVLILDSPGGDLVQGMKLGLELRRGGWGTLVRRVDGARTHFVEGAVCVSACAYAFLGGRQRQVSEGSRYGVHQFSFAAIPILRTEASEVQSLVAVIIDYLVAVGATSDIAVRALRTPPDNISWFSPADLRRYGVVTQDRANAGDAETDALLVAG